MVDNAAFFRQNKNAATDGVEAHDVDNKFAEYKDIKELRAKAKQYYKNHLQGTVVDCPALANLGMENHSVEFTRAGLGKMAATSAKEHKLLLVARLPELIRTATSATRSENVKHTRDASCYAYLHTAAEIDGAIKPVTITIFTDANGNKYYNHILPSEDKKYNQKDLSVPLAQAAQRTTAFQP